MSKKYDDFIDALAELCRAHIVSLCLSRNDGECLLVWEDEDGSNPLLPPHVTAATGIDALTHAIEAFVGNWTTPYSDGMALSAVGLIFENLRTAYSDGTNLEAREKMALASTYAGFAFTRANVG